MSRPDDVFQTEVGARAARFSISPSSEACSQRMEIKLRGDPRWGRDKRNRPCYLQPTFQWWASGLAPVMCVEHIFFALTYKWWIDQQEAEEILSEIDAYNEYEPKLGYLNVQTGEVQYATPSELASPGDS